MLPNGGSITKAAAIFKVGRATIYRWLGREDLRPTQVTHRQRKLDWEALKKDVEKNPEARLVERAKTFGVAESRYECPRNGNIVKLQVMY